MNESMREPYRQWGRKCLEKAQATKDGIESHQHEVGMESHQQEEKDLLNIAKLLHRVNNG